MTTLLNEAGFRVVSRHGYDATKGLAHEVPGLRSLVRRPGAGKWFRRIVRRLPVLERHLGHMILFVCVKATARSHPSRGSAV